jgi:hypothetical protein
LSAPVFKPSITIKITESGVSSNVELKGAPSSTAIVASLVMEETDSSGTNEILVSTLAAFQPEEQMVFPDPIDFPPGKVPKPFKETIFTETRRVSGAGPMRVDQKEDVTIGFDINNLAEDFLEARGVLAVAGDGWDPISIALTFVRAPVVEVEVEAIDLEVRQGEIVSGSVPVRWVAGAPSVICSTFGREVGSLDSLPLDIASPETVVPVRGTAEVPFVLQCGFDCPPGPKRLDAFVTRFDGSDDFVINLNVLPKPPPPPSTDLILPGGHTLRREGDMLRLLGKRVTPQLTVENETIATVNVSRSALTNEQKEQLIEATKANVKQYFLENGNHFTAAQAGAALYGAASGAAVLLTFGPSAAIPFVGPAAVKLGSNVGEFYGSIVDDLAALIKGESDANVAEIVGTMTCLFFTQINPVVQGVDLIRFMGADGWHLTREIGKAIGAGLEDAVEAAGSVVGDVVDAVGGALGDAVDFVGSIF